MVPDLGNQYVQGRRPDPARILINARDSVHVGTEVDISQSDIVGCAQPQGRQPTGDVFANGDDAIGTARFEPSGEFSLRPFVRQEGKQPVAPVRAQALPG